MCMYVMYSTCRYSYIPGECSPKSVSPGGRLLLLSVFLSVRPSQAVVVVFPFPSSSQPSAHCSVTNHKIPRLGVSLG